MGIVVRRDCETPEFALHVTARSEPIARLGEKEKGADRFHGPRQDSTRSGGELEACEPIGPIGEANFRPLPLTRVGALGL